MSQFFRGWVNVEILVLAAIYVVSRSPLVLAFVAIDLLCDLLEPMAHIYYFTPADAVDALNYLVLVPFTTVLADTGYIVAYLVIVTASMYFLLPKKKHPAQFSVTLIVIAVVAVGSDVCRGRYISEHWDTIKGRPHLVRLPAAVLAHSLVERTRMAEHWSRPQAKLPLQSAFAKTLGPNRSTVLNSRSNIVLVLLESWGEQLDAAAEVQMLEAYRSNAIDKRYQVETGLVPFSGSTIDGETRELCGHSFRHGLASASTDELRSCWPAALRDQGYQTIGINGFERRMYARDRWFPRIGFETGLFRAELAGMGMSTCQGGLIGICDADVAQYVGRRLLQAGPAKPLFISWISLNSHLPIDRDGPESDACKSGDRQHETLCIWSRLVRNVHRCIAQIASQDGLSATIFIVVGDHAPPFSAPGLRNRFSQEQVPFVGLVPRQLIAKSR